MELKSGLFEKRRRQQCVEIDSAEDGRSKRGKEEGKNEEVKERLDGAVT